MCLRFLAKHYKSIKRSFLRFCSIPRHLLQDVSAWWWEALPLAAKNQNKGVSLCPGNSYRLLNGCLYWIEKQLFMVHSFSLLLLRGKVLFSTHPASCFQHLVSSPVTVPIITSVLSASRSSYLLRLDQTFSCSIGSVLLQSNPSLEVIYLIRVALLNERWCGFSRPKLGYKMCVAVFEEANARWWEMPVTNHFK